MSRHGYMGEVYGRVRIDDNPMKIHIRVGGELAAHVNCVGGPIKGMRENFTLEGGGRVGARSTFHETVKALCASEFPLRREIYQDRKRDAEDSTKIYILVGRQRVGHILCVVGRLSHGREMFIPVTREGARLHSFASYHRAVKSLCASVFPSRRASVVAFSPSRKVV